MNRREFLLNTAAAAAAGISLPCLGASPAKATKPKRPLPKSSTDKLRVGFIGCGGRGRHLMVAEGLAKHGDIVALADCWLPQCEGARKNLPNADKINVYQDYRRLLEKEKLDVVYVPTTTHARALICIQAMQAGLDVYAEKPMSLTIAEGRAVVKAARKYNRVMQVGTQQRSMPPNVYASKLVRDGKFGKIREVIACNFLGPANWEPKPAEPMPEGLDWEAWCAQTEMRPYRKELHRSWSLWRDYDGGGQSWGVSGWGTHALDQVQCALGTDDTGPVEIWPDGKDEAGNVKVTMRYANGTLLKCHGPIRKPMLDDLGAIFIGDKGQIEILRGSFRTDRPEFQKDCPTTRPANVPGEAVEHFDNFFDCVRSRKRPNADVEIAHRATILCHLMNICRELNAKLQWDPKAERFQDNEQANALLSRPRRKGYELPGEFA
jgi:predicted dehydrogenase